MSRLTTYHTCKPNLSLLLSYWQHLGAISTATQNYPRLSFPNLPRLLTCCPRSAVIDESFRIHPPVGLILERLVPRGGVTLHSVHLPMDTVVGINAWVLHRNKEIFGEDVNEFRPERWIDSDPEQIKEMRKHLFTVSWHHAHWPSNISLSLLS